MKHILICIILLHTILNITAWMPHTAFPSGAGGEPTTEQEVIEDTIVVYYYDTHETIASAENFIWISNEAEGRIYKYWLNGTYAGMYNTPGSNDGWAVWTRALDSEEIEVIYTGGGGYIPSDIGESQPEIQHELTPSFFEKVEVRINNTIEKTNDLVNRFPYLIVVFFFIAGILIILANSLNKDNKKVRRLKNEKTKV